MTREEEIKLAAQEHRELFWDNESKEGRVAKASFIEGAVWADAHPDIDVRTMAAWRSGYKEAIERACEWLKEEYPKAAAYYEHPDSFIDKFRKAMEK